MKQIKSTYAGDGCFFCGSDNPIGLHLEFFENNGEPQELICRWRADQRFRGLGSVLHGGIQCGLFDEIMGWTAHHFLKTSSVTGSLEVRFQRPVHIGQDIEVRCHIEKTQDRSVHLIARLMNEQGQVCSQGKGVYIIVEPETFDKLMGPSD